MGIKNIPTGGRGFKATAGAGNFSRKLSAATMAGDLKNLRDNKESVVKAIKKHERAIRTGTFSSARQGRAMSEIQKLEGSKLTANDKKDISKIFKRLASKAAEDKAPTSKTKINKQLAKDTSSPKEKKEDVKTRITRLNRTSGGGLTSLKFNDRPNNGGKEEMSATAKLLARHYATKEDRVKERLPKARVNWEQERGKRFEVSSLESGGLKEEGDTNTENNGDDKTSYQPFQNL